MNYRATLSALITGATVSLVASEAGAVVKLEDAHTTGPVTPMYEKCKKSFADVGLGGLLATLEGDPAHTITIRTSGGNKTLTEDDEKAQNGTGTDSTILWTTYPPGTRTVGNCPEDACASLYHELTHALNASKGEDYAGACSPKYPIETREAEATRAENLYRSKFPGMCIRSDYDYIRDAAGTITATIKVPYPRYAGDTIPAGEAATTCAKTPVVKKSASCTGIPTPSGCSVATVGGGGACPEPTDCPLGGGARTDPHQFTYDQLEYAFHATGDFVFSRSTVDSLEIQARLAPPWPDDNITAVTAIAARVGSDVIEIYGQWSFSPTVKINGGAATLAIGTLSLPGGGGVISTRDDGSLEVRWADGSDLFVQPFGVYGLNVVMKPHKSRKTKLEGLLGNYDGNPNNDLVTRGTTTPLSNPPTFAQLYPTFANSWRPTTSLFTTAPSSSTVPASAPPAITATSSAAGAAGNAICSFAGVTDATLLSQCTYDVARTGQSGMAMGMSALQRTALQRITLTTAGAAGLNFLGIAGQRLYIDVPSTTFPDSCTAIRVYDPSGTRIDPVGAGLTSSGCIADGHGYWDTTTLPVTGTYTLKLNEGMSTTGQADVAFFYPVDQTSAIVIDGPQVTGIVATPGGAHRLTFSGTSGDTVKIDGTSNLPLDGCGVFRLLDSTGAEAFPGYSGCIYSGVAVFNNGGTTSDPLTLPATGAYTIVVDPDGPPVGVVKLSVHH